MDADMLKGGGGFFKTSGSRDPSLAGCVTVEYVVEGEKKGVGGVVKVTDIVVGSGDGINGGGVSVCDFMIRGAVNSLVIWHARQLHPDVGPQ